MAKARNKVMRNRKVSTLDGAASYGDPQKLERRGYQQYQSFLCFTGLFAARRRKGKPMAQEHTCDCCKRSVEVVNQAGLCFVCNTFQTFTAIIKDETDMNDEDALDLAGVLSDHILFAIVERLQVSNPSLFHGKPACQKI